MRTLTVDGSGKFAEFTMPIYEYYCPDNNRIYQFFAKTRAQAETTPKCPDNPAFRMVKLMSTFAIGGATRKSAAEQPAAGTRADEREPGSGGDGDPTGGDVEDPRMEAAFSQLEREMESVDENDPRAMGRMMRRMSELTGERLDGEMEEMVRRLEEGEDPEKIEEQMGDVMGGDDDDDMMGGGGGFSRGAPTRDPTLYDY